MTNALTKHHLAGFRTFIVGLCLLLTTSSALSAQEAFDFTELPPAMEGHIYKPFELTHTGAGPATNYNIVVSGLPEDPNKPGVTGGIIKSIFTDDKDTITTSDDIKQVFIQTKEQKPNSNFLPVVKKGLGGKTYNIKLTLKQKAGISDIQKDQVILPLVVHKPVELVTATHVSTLTSPSIPTSSTTPAGTVVASLESGSFASIQFNAREGYVEPNGRYTFSIVSGNLPPGMTLNSATGAIEGTPDMVGNHPMTYTTIGEAILGNPESFEFEIEVIDQWNTPTSDSGLFTIEVSDPDPGPRPFFFLPPEMLAEAQVGVPYSTTLKAFGGLLPYTWTISDLPAGLSYSSSSGVISGTPPLGSEGTYIVSLAVEDSQNPAQDYFTITGLRILPEDVNPLRIETDFLAVGTEQESYSFQLRAAGGLSTQYQWSAQGLPDGLSLVDDTIIGTFTANSASTYTVELILKNDVNEKDNVILKLLVLPTEESDDAISPTSAVQLSDSVNLLQSAAPAGCSLKAKGPTPIFMWLLFASLCGWFAMTTRKIQHKHG